MINPQEIFDIKKSFWLRMGEKVRDWIIKDSDNGLLQSGVHHYRSKQYMKYKKNYMKTFTTRTYKKGKMSGRTKTIGTNLESVKGQSVVSNMTSAVNMKLTGRTLQGLHAESATDNSVTMAFRPKDADKIIGNEELGRVIAGLSEKNIQKALDYYSKELDNNIHKWSRKEIKIYVGRNIK